MKVMNHNRVSQLMQRYWEKATTSHMRAVRALASSYRARSSTNEAAAFAVSQRVQAQASSLQAAGHHAQDAVSMLQTADSVLGGVQGAVSRMDELIQYAEDAALPDTDRGMLQEEYHKLALVVDRMGSEATFNGSQLFDGSSYTVQVGTGLQDTMEITLDPFSAQSLGLDEVDLTSPQGAYRAAESVWNAAQLLSFRRAEIGAAEDGLRSLVDGSGNGWIDLEQSLSSITGAGDLTNRGASAALGLAARSMMKNSLYLMPYNSLQLLMR